MAEQQYVIGVDLGGTHVRAGLISTNGQALSIQERALPSTRRPETGILETIQLIRSILDENHHPTILGIGAGVTGPVSTKMGTMISPYTQPAWQYIPFVEPIATEFHTRVILENDADTAALGEYWQGAGTGVDRLYVVTVGTGIGTSYILNGDIFRGKDGNHPEGGHQIIDATSGSTCYCGELGCWESLASGEAFTQVSRQYARSHPDWKPGIQKASEITAQMVIEAARNGDVIAMGLVRQEGYYLGLGLLNVISLFIPDKIILCGGMMKHFDLFEPEIRSVIAKHKILVPADEVIIQPDSLNYYAGVYGAAYAFLRSI